MLRSSLSAIGAAISSATAETPDEDTIVIDRKHYPAAQIAAIRASLPVVSSVALRPWEVESDDEKARREHEELLLARDHYVFNVFKIFDSDMSGGIDTKEFRDLAYMLGETMTEEEAEDCVRSLDIDGNGTIEFSEFLSWWNKEDVSMYGGATEGFAAKLNVLKLRLQSRSYMRTVTRLLRRSIDGAKQVKHEPLTPSSSDEALTVDISILSGESSGYDTSTGLRIESRGEDEQEYSVNAEFLVKESADLEEVRALVSKLQGYVETFLAEGMPPGVNPPDIILDEERDGGAVLKLSMALPEDFTMFGQIAGSIDATVSMTMDYNSLGDEDDPYSSPSRGRVLIQIPYSVAEMAGMFMGPTPVDPLRGAKLIKSLKFTIELSYGRDMQEVLQEFLQGLPLPPGVTLPPFPDVGASQSEALQAVKQLYASQMAQALRMLDQLPEEERGLAQDALATYYSCVKLLKGILGVTVEFGPKAVTFRSVNNSSGTAKVMPIFDILPSEEDVAAARPSYHPIEE